MSGAMLRATAAYGDSFQLHVTLSGIAPAVWRELRIPAALTLGQVHEVLQVAFGWQNSHLHDFLVGDVRLGMTDVEDELFVVDEHAAPLGAIAKVTGTFIYRYDFGDDWKHMIRVAGLTVDRDGVVLCTGGARACPPEDCGGPPGYMRMLEVLADPADEEHQEMKQWVGRGFDPERFDVAKLNKRLATLSKRFMRRPRTRR